MRWGRRWATAQWPISLVLSLYTSFLSFLIAERASECFGIKLKRKKKKKKKERAGEKKREWELAGMFLNEGEKENKKHVCGGEKQEKKKRKKEMKRMDEKWNERKEN